jgi:hypothetical protein
MKKERFLGIIQREAQLRNPNAQRAWDHAIKADDSDPRWDRIYDESMDPVELTRQYCMAFDLEYQAPAPRRRKSPVEILEARLAKEKALEGTIKPEYMEAYLSSIADLEKKLARARADED